MTEHVLTGLDGSNPLGFLAACGLLRWLAEEDEEPLPTAPRLRWVRDGVWRPVLDGPEDLEPVLQRIAATAISWTEDPALGLCYDKGGKTTYDLKPPPPLMREWLSSVRQSPRGRRFAAAYGVAEVVDNNGNVKPTALHFTAGQQVFLDMVRTLTSHVDVDALREAVYGPWLYQGSAPSLSWDSTVGRDYALRAGDPSKEKRQGVPGADWLAFLALPLHPVAAVRGALATACTGGGWKSGRYRWPLWDVPATASGVRRLLMRQDLERLSAPQRRLLGVGEVLAADIRRSDQGGYGSFGPARVATRDDRVGR